MYTWSGRSQDLEGTYSNEWFIAVNSDGHTVLHKNRFKRSVIQHIYAHACIFDQCFVTIFTLAHCDKYLRRVEN